jgi:predicted MPP superfamily phosphohydrolase
VIILDIILLIKRLFGNNSYNPNNDKLRKITLATLLLLPMVIVAIGAVHHGNIQINKYSIEINKKSAKINNLKIAFIADVHIQGSSDRRLVADCVSKLQSISSDLVLIAGDLVEGNRKDVDMKEIEKLLKQIKAKYGVYAVFGNHDSHGGKKTLNFYNNSGIKVLQDSSVKINDSFYLIGRNDSRSKTIKTIEELLEGLRTDLPIIMLDHRPSNFDSVSNNNIDIQLSGHTHNGQLFPINYITSNIYDLSWGHKIIKNTHFFVTSGLQSWGPSVKTTGASEIIVIDINFI